MEDELSIENLVKEFDKGEPEGYSRNWIDYGNFVLTKHFDIRAVKIR